MKRQCSASVSRRHANALPSAEVPQELGLLACRTSEIIEPQFLEAAPESPAIFYFSRDEQAPGARRVARKIYVASSGLSEPRREHIDRPLAAVG